MLGRKITLGEAAECGAVGIIMDCAADPVQGEGCRHGGRMGITEALERFGGGRRLDALPLVCSACGRRKVDVRPDYDFAPSKKR